MHVDTKTKSVSIKIIDRVEMLEESIADEEEILILSWESALMDNEVAFLMARFVKVLFWIYLENVVGHLESYWLKFWSDVLAGVFDVAEGLIRGAVEIWKGLLPFSSNLLEDIRGDGELRGSSIDDSWVRGVLTWLLHGFSTIEHTLSFKSPGTKPVLKVLESFEAICTTFDLGRVITTEKGIWTFAHLFGGN